MKDKYYTLHVQLNYTVAIKASDAEHARQHFENDSDLTIHHGISTYCEQPVEIKVNKVQPFGSDVKELKTICEKVIADRSCMAGHMECIPSCESCPFTLPDETECDSDKLVERAKELLYSLDFDEQMDAMLTTDDIGEYSYEI